MSLGEDELVFGTKNPMAQRQQQVKAREVASDMPDSTLIMHPEQSKRCASAQIAPGSGRSLHGH